MLATINLRGRGAPGIEPGAADRISGCSNAPQNAYGVYYNRSFLPSLHTRLSWQKAGFFFF
jgi:hypothetical protein